jgi:CubicO group peptidase (beta-lactamase class C family)
MSVEHPSGPVGGYLAPGYEAAGEAFAGLLDEDAAYSAQFCAYVAGELVVDIWGGPDILRDSIQGVFSATKGVTAVCIALMVERGQLDLDAPVARYWPEFAQGGKADVSVRLVLSHQAGLVGVEPQVNLDELLDHKHMAVRVAGQRPHWRPGAGHGYHALTIGTVMDELVRRVDGRPVATFFREEIGDPRDIDFYIATPESEEPRVLDVLPARAVAQDAEHGPGGTDEVAAPAVDSLTGMAFNAAVFSLFDPLISNLRSVRAAGLAAGGGAGSARGLARLYAACISEVDGMPRLLSPKTVTVVSQMQAVGQDLVLPHHTRFAIGFQKAEDRLWYGSHQAFGHDGAGGAVGVADPWHALAYGYVPRRMTNPDGADARGLGLARTVRECTTALRP